MQPVEVRIVYVAAKMVRAVVGAVALGGVPVVAHGGVPVVTHDGVPSVLRVDILAARLAFPDPFWLVRRLARLLGAESSASTCF